MVLLCRISTSEGSIYFLHNGSSWILISNHVDCDYSTPWYLSVYIPSVKTTYNKANKIKQGHSFFHRNLTVQFFKFARLVNKGYATKCGSQISIYHSPWSKLLSIYSVGYREWVIVIAWYCNSPGVNWQDSIGIFLEYWLYNVTLCWSRNSVFVVVGII